MIEPPKIITCTWKASEMTFQEFPKTPANTSLYCPGKAGVALCLSVPSLCSGPCLCTWGCFLIARERLCEALIFLCRHVMGAVGSVGDFICTTERTSPHLGSSKHIGAPMLFQPPPRLNFSYPRPLRQARTYISKLLLENLTQCIQYVNVVRLKPENKTNGWKHPSADGILTRRPQTKTWTDCWPASELQDYLDWVGARVIEREVSLPRNPLSTCSLSVWPVSQPSMTWGRQK